MRSKQFRAQWTYSASPEGHCSFGQDREKQEAGRAKREARTNGVSLPPVASISLVLVLPFPQARAVGIHDKKTAGRKTEGGSGVHLVGFLATDSIRRNYTNVKNDQSFFDQRRDGKELTLNTTGSRLSDIERTVSSPRSVSWDDECTVPRFRSDGTA